MVLHNQIVMSPDARVFHHPMLNLKWWHTTKTIKIICTTISHSAYSHPEITGQIISLKISNKANAAMLRYINVFDTVNCINSNKTRLPGQCSAYIAGLELWFHFNWRFAWDPEPRFPVESFRSWCRSGP